MPIRKVKGGYKIDNTPGVSKTKKAAKQRRHVIMIGDPGTGKSMLAKSMVELYMQGFIQ